MGSALPLSTRGSALHPQPDHLFQIAERYTIRDELRIPRFLEAHSFLFDLLFAASARIESYFPGRPLILEHITDPDAERLEQADHLVLCIATDQEVSEAMTQLQRFEADWWLDALPRAHGALSIDLLFV